MVLLENAIEQIHSLSFAPEVISLSIEEAEGYILAQDIYSDINLPPFDKSAMDGYACRKQDLNHNLEVIEQIAAGAIPELPIQAGQCAKIMTGAMVPKGANCVVKVEDTQTLEGNRIQYIGAETKSNICRLGEDVVKGQKLLSKNTLLRFQHIGIAASVGYSQIKVFRKPIIGILSTGNELIEPFYQPGISQIRNSNAYNLQSQCKNLGCQVIYGGIVEDDKRALDQAINELLSKVDIIVLSGGVSMGDFDYVEEILANNGLSIRFNRVAIQPGKPIVLSKGDNKACVGLSGNPVSSLLQFELLAKPLIYQFQQFRWQHQFIRAKINTNKSRKKTERMQFFPVTFANGIAKPIEFNGSAHLTGLNLANGFGIFPLGSKYLAQGTEIEILLF